MRSLPAYANRTTRQRLSFRPLRRVGAAARGFTLIELMIVVIVVSIMAAMAVPAMIRARDDRHTYDNAMSLAQMVRGARLRAIGRGGAVAVHMQAGAGERGTYQVVEAVTWNTPATATDFKEWRTPIASCLSPNWAAPPTSGNAFALDGLTFDYNLDVQIDFQSTMTLRDATGASTSPTELWLCFTPAGRTYAVAGAAPTFTTNGTFRDVTVCMKRGGCGGAGSIGISRTLLVPPTGVARVFSQ